MKSLVCKGRLESEPISNLEITIVFPASPSNWLVTQRRVGDSLVLEQLQIKGDVNNSVMDPYSLREAFEEVTNVEQARDFLAHCGPFKRAGVSITWSEFVGWQQWFLYQRMPARKRVLMPELSDATELLRVIGIFHVEMHPSETGMCGLVDCESAVEAIAATIHFDHLSKRRFQMCQRCNRIFEVTKDNGRRYCSHDCAHRAGQQRRRAAAKAQIGTAIPKMINGRVEEGKG